MGGSEKRKEEWIFLDQVATSLHLVTKLEQQCWSDMSLYLVVPGLGCGDDWRLLGMTGFSQTFTFDHCKCQIGLDL
jgi:hypothetical protein